MLICAITILLELLLLLLLLLLLIIIISSIPYWTNLQPPDNIVADKIVSH